MKTGIRITVKYLLSAAAAVVLLYFSFRGVDWTDFWSCLKSCEWSYVIVSMVACLLVYVVRGLRWKMLLEPIDPSVGMRACFNAVSIGMISNLVLPRVGELVRCAYITRNSARDGEGKRIASYDKVFGTVVMERGLDSVFMVVVFVIMMSLMWRRFGSFFSENIFPGLSSKLGMVWMLLGVLALIAALVWCVRLLRGRNRFFAKVYEVCSGIGQGLKACLHMKHGWLFFVYTGIVWVLYWVMSYSIVLAVKHIDPSILSADALPAMKTLQGLGVVDALFLMLAGALSSLVPVPGGFGAFHTVVAGALQSVYGIPFSIGLIFATLSHEAQTVTQIIAGLFSFAWEALTGARNNV